MRRCAKLPICFLVLSLTYCSSASAQSKPKLPKPIDLTKAVNLVRDPATGELAARTGGDEGASGEITTGETITVTTKFLLAPCSAANPDGSPLRNLHTGEFELKLDGNAQDIAHLDASETFANIALVLDSSPSEGHAIGDMKATAQSLAANLAAQDRVSVVAFAGHAHLLLPLSTDRSLLQSALSRVDLMRSDIEIGSNIYSAIYLTAQEVFSEPSSASGRNAIVVLTDGQDDELPLSWNPGSMQAEGKVSALSFEDVAKILAARGIQLFVISTEPRPKPMTPGWLAAHSNSTLISSESRHLQVPPYTIFLAELVRQAGGSLYFLHEAQGLGEVYRRIAMTLHAEYILSASLAGGTTRSGWHGISVALRDPRAHDGARIDCRRSYYVPNSGRPTPQQ